jgi:hypothetical protein
MMNQNMNNMMNQNMNNMMNQNMNNMMNQNMNSMNYSNNKNILSYWGNMQFNMFNNNNNFMNDGIPFDLMMQNKNNCRENNSKDNFENIQPNSICLFFKESLSDNRISIFITPNEKIIDLIQKYRDKSNNKDDSLIFLFNASVLNFSKTVGESGLKPNSTIIVTSIKPTIAGGGEINIQFIRISKGYITNKICNEEILSLLKLCLLKEISVVLSEEKIKTLPELVRCIIRILSKGFVKDGNNIKDKIEQILLKVDGDNIINFSD